MLSDGEQRQMTLDIYQIMLLSSATTILGWFGGYFFMAKKFDELEENYSNIASEFMSLNDDVFLILNENEELREVIHATAGAGKENAHLSVKDLSGVRSPSACDCA